MKDEIIDNIKADLLYCYKDGYSTKEEYERELNYITNLQREVRANNDLIPYFKNKEKELKKKITNLQEEKERLKELCDKYEEEHNTAFKLWTMKMEEIPTYEEKKELQNRIDKAIEYINISLRDSFENDKYPLNGEDFELLLNILEGKSDE